MFYKTIGMQDTVHIYWYAIPHTSFNFSQCFDRHECISLKNITVNAIFLNKNSGGYTICKEFKIYFQKFLNIK